MDKYYNLGNTKFHSSDVDKTKEKNEMVVKMIKEKKITTFGELSKFLDNIYSRQSMTDF